MFLCITIPAIAQKQGNIWYFGNYAGVDFNTSPPTALTDGKLSTSEGCSSISDADGKLLFYTDGITVYNKQHDVMTNGTGLYGDPSSTQSGVIVPHPGNPNLYYVFTVQLQGGSLYYSVIDISKQSGLGEVIEKNTMLLIGSTEKITAVRHKTNQAIWVITHEYPSQNFVTYLIDKNGLQAVPVVSKIGTFMGQSPLSTIGYLKASPKGDKLAAAMDYNERIVEIYDFDAATGKISNPVTLTGFGSTGPYGVEFSPNGKFLYVSEEGFFDAKLYQIKLPVQSNNVNNVSYVVSQEGNIFALQLATDGKIYASRSSNTFLAAIEEPNLEGPLCKFNLSAIDLKGRYTVFGLPTFIQSFFAEVSFTANGTCIGNITQFAAKSSLEGIDSLRWDFGDAKSLPQNNTLALETPSHKYTDTGSYNVVLKAYSKGVMTPYQKTIVISPIPSIDFGKDTTLFYGQTLLLDAKWPGSTYKWNTGTTGQTLLVTSPGTYSVDVTSSAGCSGSGSIKVSYDQVIDVTLPADTTICAFETIKLDATLSGGSYLWSNGSTSSSIMVSQEGQYSVKITNAYHSREKHSVSMFIFSGSIL